MIISYSSGIRYGGSCFSSSSKDSILDFFGLDNVGGSVEIAEWIDLPGRDFCCTPVVDDILCLLVRLELGKSEVA